VKRRQLERHLREHGCRKLDEGGNHTRWAAPSGSRSAVPRHREIDWKLARSICRQLQIPAPEGSR
jgi:predicted RNA binding protein YcfA (HicA-like mRNA interferase family)